jgi:tRNA 5-methylaminomethyl-2-thiouridine biosynthesis bifunctional protein
MKPNMQFSAPQWQDQCPRSVQFDDVYFSTENGLDETEYVFIAGNQLQTRFSHTEITPFNIIETGFGTGLNFYCAISHWLTRSKQQRQLCFTSVEKFPLLPADMQQIAAIWPQYTELVSSLLPHYETIHAGLNSFELLDGQIQLKLWIGDIHDALPQLDTPADAWFLDGFSPAKNPEMWTPAVFENIGRLSKLGTTFATFTSAGHVRRGLQSVGFDVQRYPGFGKKREMLKGCFLGSTI